MKDSAFEIVKPERILREQDGKIYEVEGRPWIKLSTVFRDYLRELKPAETVVFICLALHVGKDHKAWPTLNTLQLETNLSRNTVLAAIAALEARGWITVERQHRKVNIYSIKIMASYGEQDPHIWVQKLNPTQILGSSGDTLSSVGGTQMGSPGELQVELERRTKEGEETPAEKNTTKPLRLVVEPEGRVILFLVASLDKLARPVAVFVNVGHDFLVGGRDPKPRPACRRHDRRCAGPSA